MNKQKLISVLQSRIAKRGMLLKTGWNSFADKDYKHDRWFLKFRMIKLGLEQKEDKQILKQLVEDEREIKKWKKAFAETDLMLWETQQKEGDESKRRVY